MSEKKGHEVVISNDSNQMPDIFSADTAAQRQEVIQAIESYSEKLDTLKLDRNSIKCRLKLMQMRDRVTNGESLAAVEKDLWTMALDIEEPTLRMQRNVAGVIIAYSLFALIAFLILTFTDAIMIPSFNIPYSVLMMGLLGCLVSMYVKLPNIRARKPVSYDSTLWFIISPPIAVIMAGIVFGVIQIFLPLFQINLSDESWFFWIVAWVVGFVNWVNLYDKLSLKIRSGILSSGLEQSEEALIVENPEVTGN